MPTSFLHSETEFPWLQNSPGARLPFPYAHDSSSISSSSAWPGLSHLINSHHMVSLAGCGFLHLEMLQFITYSSQQNVVNQRVLNHDKLFFHRFTVDAITQSRVLFPCVFLISCLSFNLTNIYWAQPNKGPGLGVAMDPEAGERKSLPFWSI